MSNDHKGTSFLSYSSHCIVSMYCDSYSVYNSDKSYVTDNFFTEQKCLYIWRLSRHALTSTVSYPTMVMRPMKTIISVSKIQNVKLCMHSELRLVPQRISFVYRVQSSSDKLLALFFFFCKSGFWNISCLYLTDPLIILLLRWSGTS